MGFDPSILIGLAYAGASIMAGLAVVGAGVGLGVAGNGVAQGMARQPEQAGAIRTNFFIVVALVEGLAIIVIALSFVFPNMATTSFEELANQAKTIMGNVQGE
jgi:F-type H+-transporting ATPase subunit c